jgi:hypothetical protein
MSDDSTVPWVKGYTKRSKITGEMYRKPARPLANPKLQTMLGVKQSPEHYAKTQPNRLKNAERLVESAAERINSDLPTYRTYEYIMTTKSTQEIAGVMMTRELSKQIRKASEELINENKERWLNDLHLAAKVILEKAIEERDPQAMMAVWDRVVGKPTTQVDMSVTNETTVDDIATKLRQMNEQTQLKEITHEQNKNTPI